MGQIQGPGENTGRSKTTGTESGNSTLTNQDELKVLEHKTAATPCEYSDLKDGDPKNQDAV